MPFIDGRSPMQEDCSHSLTCGDDVVDAGDDLPAHQVGRPAQHRPVVHLRARRVGEQAGGALKKKEGEDTSSVRYFGPTRIPFLQCGAKEFRQVRIFEITATH